MQAGFTATQGERARATVRNGAEEFHAVIANTLSGFRVSKLHAKESPQSTC